MGISPKEIAYIMLLIPTVICADVALTKKRFNWYLLGLILGFFYTLVAFIF